MYRRPREIIEFTLSDNKLIRMAHPPRYAALRSVERHMARVRRARPGATQRGTALVSGGGERHGRHGRHRRHGRRRVRSGRAYLFRPVA